MLKTVYDRLRRYHTSVKLYVVIICLDLLIKKNSFFPLSNFDFSVKIPLILIILILFCALKVGGKKFFIETSYYALIAYIAVFLLYLLFFGQQNGWGVIWVYFILKMYIFVQSIFILIAILFLNDPSPKISNNYKNKLYFTISIVATFAIPYLGRVFIFHYFMI